MGILRVYPGRGTRGPPTGPAGWDIPVPAHRLQEHARCTQPPTPAPWASGARFAAGFAPRGGWVVLRYSTPITHPVYPTLVHPPGTPWYTDPAMNMQCQAGGSPRACTYDRFDLVVGEPRGIEYMPVSGSRTGLYTFLRLTRPFDWVLDLFY